LTNLLSISKECLDECTGWYHSPEDFVANKNILMGGVRGQMQISNHLLTNGLTRCDLQKTPVCGRKIHRIEKSGCFYDYTDVIKYSEHILQTTTIQVWHPDTKIDQLPFPKTFNTTTISSNVIKVCEDISVVCHDYKSLDNIWSPFFVCHSKNGTKT
ncbi:unnamed protein product, partial [Rotaria sp. Silwood1]